MPYDFYQVRSAFIKSLMVESSESDDKQADQTVNWDGRDVCIYQTPSATLNKFLKQPCHSPGFSKPSASSLRTRLSKIKKELIQHKEKHKLQDLPALDTLQRLEHEAREFTSVPDNPYDLLVHHLTRIGMQTGHAELFKGPEKMEQDFSDGICHGLSDWFRQAFLSGDLASFKRKMCLLTAKPGSPVKVGSTTFDDLGDAFIHVRDKVASNACQGHSTTPLTEGELELLELRALLDTLIISQKPALTDLGAEVGSYNQDEDSLTAYAMPTTFDNDSTEGSEEVQGYPKLWEGAFLHKNHKDSEAFLTTMLSSLQRGYQQQPELPPIVIRFAIEKHTFAMGVSTNGFELFDQNLIIEKKGPVCSTSPFIPREQFRSSSKASSTACPSEEVAPVAAFVALVHQG